MKSPKALLAMVGLTCGACYGTWDWPIDRTTRVGGNFNSMERMEVIAGERAGRFSPLCGCESEFPQFLWHGIVFARQKAEVGFRDAGDTPYYLGMAAAEPKQITPFGYVNLEIVFHVKEDSGKIKIYGPKKIAGFSLVLQDTFEIYPRGIFPQFAILPPRNARVALELGDDDAILLSSDSPDGASITPGKGGTLNPDEVHAIDVLGPKVSIRFSKPPFGAAGNGAKSHDAFDGLVNELGFSADKIQQIDLTAPFAVRLSFGHLEFPNGPPIAGATNEDGNVLGGKGKFSVIARGAVEQDTYQIAKNEVGRERRVWSEQTRDAPEDYSEKMLYRMPFIAPRLGYQVYGEHEKFELKSVSGGLTLGSRDYPITGSANLEFKNIKPLIEDRSLPSAPLQFSVGRQGELQFQADSTVKVNGEEVISSKYTIGSAVGIVGAALTIVTGLMQLLSRRRKHAA